MTGLSEKVRAAYLVSKNGLSAGATQIPGANPTAPSIEAAELHGKAVKSGLAADYIAAGRAYAATLHVREAIACCSEGLILHPDDAFLYRWRGHRHISVREFASGEADLTRASILNDGDWNIWYHLGLARYLRGNYAGAIEAYRKCAACPEDAIAAPAVIDWMWMSAKRTGDDETAAFALSMADPGLDAGENQYYQNRVLVYLGLKKPEDLYIAPDGKRIGPDDPLGVSTQLYGLANWYYVSGETEKAHGVIAEILEFGFWPGFGYIAAEVDAKTWGLL